MQRIAKTTDEFIEHWGQKQNFLIAPECIGFDMDFPPVEEVIDLLRCDPAVNVVAWQLAGEKTFNGFLDPDKYAPIEERVIRGDPLRAKAPPEYDEADVLAYHMEPGDLLWNQLLTPHWVVAGEDQAAMSLNISHGLVRYRGEFGPNEALLHQRWEEYPDEAWLADLRY